MAMLWTPFSTQSCGIVGSERRNIAFLMHVGQQWCKYCGIVDVKRRHLQKRSVWSSGRQGDGLVYSKGTDHFKALARSQGSTNQLQQILGVYDTIEGLEQAVSYLFRTEGGDLVKVLVGSTGTTNSVYIEVPSLDSECQHKLTVSWGIFRSDSSSLDVPDLESQAMETSQSMRDPEHGSFRTPFMKNSSGKCAVKLEFDCKQVPFYLTFVLISSSEAAAIQSEIRTHRKTNFCVPVGIGRGYPTPLGVSISDDGLVNFSLFSRNADAVVLCLYEENTDLPSLEIELDSYVNRTGDIWHISIENVKKYVGYGYRCKRSALRDNGNRFHRCHILLDPYAKKLRNFLPDEGEFISVTKCLGSLIQEPEFDWNGDTHPSLPMERLAVYRLNVAQFTKDNSSRLAENVAGTFRGVIQKLQHIKSLGFNAILLEPISPFDEKKGPYYPYHFFSAMNSFGGTADGASANNSMKEMVKALHENDMEVYLEVVFSHTSEGGDAACQMISFRGIDSSSYYVVDGDMGSETNNLLSCNSPIVQQMILDSLRHWVTDFHIDGFCFINASHLLRGMNGEHLSRSPIVEAIAFDPLLSKTKIVADFWSPLDMSHEKIDFPHWRRWAEMNVKFCTDVRNFLRGEGVLSDLATRLCGSGDVFSDSRGPAFAFNYVARNSGLSLVDLVSFSADHLSLELSWNCGDEGPTSSSLVLETRLKQVRNFLFILFVSLGVPVINMGDEFGYSGGGSLFHGDREPINWDYLKTGFSAQIMQFIEYLNSLRIRRSDIFQKKGFLKVENIDWHGSGQSKPNWEDPSSKFLAVTLKAETDSEITSPDEGDMFLCFNASDLSDTVVLPEISEGTGWLRLVDTALEFPGFFSNNPDSNPHQLTGSSTYELKPHSCALFEMRKSNSGSR